MEPSAEEQIRGFKRVRLDRIISLIRKSFDIHLLIYIALFFGLFTLELSVFLFSGCSKTKTTFCISFYRFFSFLLSFLLLVIFLKMLVNTSFKVAEGIRYLLQKIGTQVDFTLIQVISFIFVAIFFFLTFYPIVAFTLFLVGCFFDGIFHMESGGCYL